MKMPQCLSPTQSSPIFSPTACDKALKIGALRDIIKFKIQNIDDANVFGESKKTKRVTCKLFFVCKGYPIGAELIISI